MDDNIAYLRSRRHRHYILDGTTPVPVHDLLTWAAAFETKGNVLAKDEFDGLMVSTIFLGLDHRWGDGPPILFETMVFGGWYDGHQLRHETYKEALLYHELLVQTLRKRRIRNLAVLIYEKLVTLWSSFLEKYLKENK